MTAEKQRALTEEELRALKEHWEWGGGYAIIWALFTILLFGGAYFLLDYIGAGDGVRIPDIHLACDTRSCECGLACGGALAARIDVGNRARRPDKAIGIPSGERER